MTITGALVLYSVFWFLTFYIVLQIRTKPQDEAGTVVPGTPRGAPATENVGSSARIATIWATLIWAVVAGVLYSGKISIRDIDYFGRMGGPGAAPAPSDP